MGLERHDRLRRQRVPQGGLLGMDEDVAGVGLGRQVGEVEGRGGELQGLRAGDLQPLRFERGHLVGIVGEDDERRP